MDAASNLLVKQLIITAATAPIGFGLTAKLGFVKGFVAGKAYSATYGAVFDDSLNVLVNSLDDDFSEQDDLIVRINGVKVIPSTFSQDSYPMFKDNVYPNEVTGTYMNFADVQLIEYDSGSDNDDLGSFWAKDETLLDGAIEPFNEDTVTIQSNAEDGSVYNVTYKLEPGLGQLADIPERIICSYGECVDTREPIPRVFDADPFDIFSDDSAITCPKGYYLSTYTSEEFSEYLDNQILGICELLPHLLSEEFPTPCGADFFKPSDPNNELQDGDVVVFQNKHLPNKLNGQYISSPVDGQYLANCKNCAVTVGSLPDTAFVHVLDPNRSSAQWIVKRLPDYKFAFMGENGKYLARCDGCIIGGPSQHATVHVDDPTTEPAAQFTFNRVSDNDYNEFAFTLASPNGYLLRAVPMRIPGQDHVNNSGIRASASFLPTGNYGEEMWQIKRLTNLAAGSLASEINSSRATLAKTIYTIGVNQTVTIHDGVSLKIINGSKLINNGTLIVNGTLVIDDLGEIQNSGNSSIIINNGFINNNGGVIINDSVIDNSQAKYLKNNGIIKNNKFIYDPYRSRYFGSQPQNNPRNSGYYIGPGLNAERACLRLNGSLDVKSCTIQNIHLQVGQSLSIYFGYSLIINDGIFNEGEIINSGVIDLSQGVIHQCGVLNDNGQILNQANLLACVVSQEQTKCETYGGSFVPGATLNTGTCNSPTKAVQYEEVLTIPTGVTWNINAHVPSERFNNFGTINIEEGGTMNLNLVGHMLNDGAIYNYGTFIVGIDDGLGFGFEFDTSDVGYFANHGTLVHDGEIIFSYTNGGSNGYVHFVFYCDGTYINNTFATVPAEHIDILPCDPTDSDDDGVVDNEDDLPLDPTESVDSDGDGVADSTDLFPYNSEDWADTDGDCEGFNTETAGLGCGDNSDQFPLNPLEQKDSDGDCGNLNLITQNQETGNGCADNSDAFKWNGLETKDTDEDGVGDNSDAFPLDDTETLDTDLDTVGNNSDPFPNDFENTRLVDTGNGWSKAFALFSAESRGDIIPLGLPGDLVMNRGMIKLKLQKADGSPGESAVVTLTYPIDIDPVAVWYNYGPTTSDPTPHWYQNDSIVINGKIVKLTVTDGLDGDADMLANLAISMLGGPAVSESAIDDDGDGMSNLYEIANGLNPLVDDAALDADSDGLTNLQEYTAGTSSILSDTDGDGLSDYDEVITHGTDPNLTDTDNDGMSDSEELANGLNPLDGSDCPAWMCGSSKVWMYKFKQPTQ